MQIDSKVLSSVERFLELAREAAGEPWRSEDFYLVTQGQRKYVIITAGMFHFKVDGETGEIRCFRGRRYPHRPNIRDYVNREDWRSGQVGISGNCVPSLAGRKCAVCGRTEAVAQTKLGLHCRYCRASDTRRIAELRQLGATPMLNGRPLCGDIYQD